MESEDGPTSSHHEALSVVLFMDCLDDEGISMLL